MKSQHRIGIHSITGKSKGLLLRGTACLWLLASLALCGWLAPAAHASDGGSLSGAPEDVYDGEQADSNSGPVRLASFSYLNGDVSWRTDAQSDWSAAARNLPLRQGAQIQVADGSRAEVQFDDGSRMRLDSNTLVTLQTLYSDAEGEFTEITVNDGQIFLRLNNRYSVYQINAPAASLKASGPAHLRIGAGEDTQFAVRQGQATVEGANGKVTLQEGDYLDVADDNSPYQVTSLPRTDQWDAWNDSRDRQIDDSDDNRYLPPNIALVSDDLSAYGDWHNDPTYGRVWAPREADPEWRPYCAGRWTWVEPFGWTWVADEPWGWAPYHYGTWIHASYGWGWCPGPATQYWSPAVVSFYENDGYIAWCPLAPREVVYPSALSVGFRSGRWSLFFSIGGAAAYYPTRDHICEARPWSSSYVNHVTYVNNVTNITNITVNHNTYVNNNFVPSNARFAGGTQVAVENFASSRTAYRRVSGANLSVFTRGRAIGAPTGGRPIVGPQVVRVTRQALTPARSFMPRSSVSQALVSRPVFRAPLPASVPRSIGAAQPGQRFISRRSPINEPVTNRVGAAQHDATRPGGFRDSGTTDITHNRPGGFRNDGTISGRANTPAPNTGRSSGLDQYLRERNAASGRNTYGNNSTGTNTGRYQPGSVGSRSDRLSNPRTDNYQRTQSPHDYNRPTRSDPNTQSRRYSGDYGSMPGPRGNRNTDTPPSTQRNYPGRTVPDQTRTYNQPPHNTPSYGPRDSSPGRGGNDTRSRTDNRNTDKRSSDRSNGGPGR